MKLLMTTDTIGGVWTYAIELTKSLAKFDIEVHLACMGKILSDDQQQQVEKIKNLTIYTSDFKLEWMEDPWEDVEKAGDWLLGLQDHIEPDIIHLNNYVHGTLDWNAPVVVTVHSCVLTWWQSVKKENAPAKWDHYYKKVNEGLQAADLVIGVSHNYLKEMTKIYSPLKLALVIYNGLDPEAYFIRNKKQVIMGMGRIWDEGKNLNMLASLSGSLKWPVYIAGSIDYSHNKEKKNNGNGVNFLGQSSQDQIKNCLSESSIYVLPALYEPFGLSALEAAFSGCALVLSDIPTLREIWGDSAIYFETDNTKKLKEAINSLIEDENLLIQYQMKAKEWAQHYHINKMTKSYIDAYRQVLMNKRQNMRN